jgi:putative methionine-R-sulfoxide reductase with GAF domain
MSENLTISSSESREEKYKTLLPQIEALIADEDDQTANLANISAALKQTFEFLPGKREKPSLLMMWIYFLDILLVVMIRNQRS